ncbi:MAG: hypothetical protein NVS3B10_18430 [Polyangiales bacterium]
MLGASNDTYAEATRTQQIADWIGAHVRCFDFLGGVPRDVVPDQLKSGVTGACRYEPKIQRTYEASARRVQRHTPAAQVSPVRHSSVDRHGRGEASTSAPSVALPASTSLGSSGETADRVARALNVDRLPGACRVPVDAATLAGRPQGHAGSPRGPSRPPARACRAAAAP